MVQTWDGSFEGFPGAGIYDGRPRSSPGLQSRHTGKVLKQTMSAAQRLRDRFACGDIVTVDDIGGLSPIQSAGDIRAVCQQTLDLDRTEFRSAINEHLRCVLVCMGTGKALSDTKMRAPTNKIRIASDTNKQEVFTALSKGRSSVEPKKHQPVSQEAVRRALMALLTPAEIASAAQRTPSPAVKQQPLRRPIKQPVAVAKSTASKRATGRHSHHHDVDSDEEPDRRSMMLKPQVAGGAPDQPPSSPWIVRGSVRTRAAQGHTHEKGNRRAALCSALAAGSRGSGPSSATSRAGQSVSFAR